MKKLIAFFGVLVLSLSSLSAQPEEVCAKVADGDNCDGLATLYIETCFGCLSVEQREVVNGEISIPVWDWLPKGVYKIRIESSYIQCVKYIEKE